MYSIRPVSAQVLALLFAILVAGCVTLTPQQRDTVADVQRFADVTAAAYNLSRIRVTIEPSTNLGLGGRYRQGNFYLNVRELNSGHLTALVAHELAHYVLGHDTRLPGASTAEFQRAQEQLELDANAKAVEILVRVKEMTQPQAVRTMVIRLRTAQSFQERGGARAWGHRPPAEEIADLLARFPGLDPPAEPQSPGKMSPSSIPGPILAPRWKPGDEWTFWWESPRGSGTFVWSIAGEEIIDGVEHYVLRYGREGEALFTKPELAWHIDKNGGVITARAEPPQLRYKWPLTVGTEWEQQVTTERPVDRTTNVKIRSCRVETEEIVTVSAGSFRTFKTVCRNKQTDETIHQYWYAPEVRNMVKEWSRFPWGVQERELITYKPK